MSKYTVFSSLWGRNFAVLEAFVQRHGGSLVISENDPGPVEHQRIAQSGGQVLGVRSFLDAPAQAAVRATYAQRRQALGDHLDSATWQAQCAAHGWSPELMARAALGQVDQQLEKAVLLTAALDRAHAQHPIDVVVVAEDVTPTGRAVTGWARQRGVPSLQLAHGLAFTPPYTISEGLDTDLLAVFGDRGKDGFLDIGVHPDRLIATGNPTWDDYPAMVQRRSALRAELAAAHQIPAQLPWLVFGTTWCAYVSARNDGGINSHCLEHYIIACRKLQLMGVEVQPVVKSRPNNSAALLAEIQLLCQRHHYPQERVLLATGDPKAWVVSADVFISMDSNLGVEAMLCGTTSINLLNGQGVMLGPCLDSHSGIVEVDPSGLLPVLCRVLSNPEVRAELRAQGQASALRYNIGIDGRATERVVDLMARMAGQRHARALASYQLGLLTRRPGRVLVLGRATGSAARTLRQQLGQCEVWGVEPDALGAALSRPYMDHLLVGELTDLDLPAAGWRPEMFDTVLLDDALQCAADPAQLLRTLRPYLRADAQLLLCVTNARNLRLAQELLSGRCHGERSGMDDQRYARLFSYQDILRLLALQRCAVGQVSCVPDAALDDIKTAYQDRLPGDLTLDRLVLRDVSAADLVELTAQYFVLRCAPLPEPLAA